MHLLDVGMKSRLLQQSPESGQSAYLISWPLDVPPPGTPERAAAYRG